MYITSTLNCSHYQCPSRLLYVFHHQCSSYLHSNPHHVLQLHSNLTSPISITSLPSPLPSMSTASTPPPSSSSHVHSTPTHVISVGNGSVSNNAPHLTSKLESAIISMNPFSLQNSSLHVFHLASWRLHVPNTQMGVYTTAVLGLFT